MLEIAMKFFRNIIIFKSENAVFNYQNISKENLEAFYETNLFKVRTNEGHNFGTLKDVDGTLYEAYEILFHTPGEHTVKGVQIDMEI
jgi:carbonic anhydrase